MRPVTIDELLPLGAYEQVREHFRARIIEHKKVRRLFVGPEVTLVFEDHDTVLLQVQEILRAERISEAKALRDEVAVYNDLVPPDGALLATLMIELEDAPTRERRRREMVGIDDAVHFVVGPHRVTGSFDPVGSYPDRTAAVRYVTFQLPPEARALLLDGTHGCRIVIDHRAYKAEAELSQATRASLARDLDPENAARRPG